MAKVVHFEIPFDNKARAMKFYAETFGWELADMPEFNYVAARSVDVDDQFVPKEPGAINGGLTERPKEAPAPVLYIDVPSVEQAIEQVEAAGGTVVTPLTTIPDMGAYARVTDTEGNVIGLYQGS